MGLGQDAVQFSYFFGQVGGWVGGWVGGEMKIKANLSLSLVEVEAELGNNINTYNYLAFCYW